MGEIITKKEFKENIAKKIRDVVDLLIPIYMGLSGFAFANALICDQPPTAFTALALVLLSQVIGIKIKSSSASGAVQVYSVAPSSSMVTLYSF